MVETATVPGVVEMPPQDAICIIHAPIVARHSWISRSLGQCCRYRRSEMPPGNRSRRKQELTIGKKKGRDMWFLLGGLHRR